MICLLWTCKLLWLKRWESRKWFPLTKRCHCERKAERQKHATNRIVTCILNGTPFRQFLVGFSRLGCQDLIWTFIQDLRPLSDLRSWWLFACQDVRPNRNLLNQWNWHMHTHTHSMFRWCPQFKWHIWDDQNHHNGWRHENKHKCCKDKKPVKTNAQRNLTTFIF